MAGHRETIVDQFTRQAVPFSNAPAIRDEAALGRLVAFAGAGPEDVVLDVACGPGLLVRAFAGVVRVAAGIDVTPAMLVRARQVAAEAGVGNVAWHVGDALRMPFRDGAFSIVTSRFAVHHWVEPAAIVREMARVCRPGGTVVVADVSVSDDAEKAAAFNRMEKLRDPSHVRGLSVGELTRLFVEAGLPEPRIARDRLPSDVEGMLARSFPQPGDADRVRRLFAETLADDGLGLGAYRYGEQIRFAYPVALLAARLQS